MQTSLEFLNQGINELEVDYELQLISKSNYWIKRKELLEKAKEMHRQEIMVARQDGFNRFFRKGDRKEVSNEQYYQDTFKID
jgi:hypothetical protein